MGIETHNLKVAGSNPAGGGRTPWTASCASRRSRRPLVTEHRRSSTPTKGRNSPPWRSPNGFSRAGRGVRRMAAGGAWTACSSNGYDRTALAVAEVRGGVSARAVRRLRSRARHRELDACFHPRERPHRALGGRPPSEAYPLETCGVKATGANGGRCAGDDRGAAQDDPSTGPTTRGPEKRNRSFSVPRCRSPATGTIIPRASHHGPGTPCSGPRTVQTTRTTSYLNDGNVGRSYRLR